jgi:hypothetical protein
MSVLLCGDSYYDIFDCVYPKLHWANRLPVKAYILARGGCSNFSIWHQIQQALFFSPSLVLVSFTGIPRVEFPKKEIQDTLDLTKFDSLIDRQWHYRNTVLNNLDHAIPNYNQDKFTNWLPYYIEEYELLKNIMYIKSALDFLVEHNIPYKYTLGGFEQFHKDFGVHNIHNVLPNGKMHPEQLASPHFHIKDEVWHQEHADLVSKLLDNLKAQQ